MDERTDAQNGGSEPWFDRKQLYVDDTLCEVSLGSYIYFTKN